MFMPQPVLKIYYDALEEGRILGIKCADCGHIQWPPMPTCNECGCLDGEWCEISGEAVMEDFTAVIDKQAYDPLLAYYPYHTFMGRLKEGMPISGIVFGIDAENEEVLRGKLPVKIKAKILPMDDEFKAVAWELAE